MSDIPAPARPSAELLERLREDKRRMHAAARALPLAEKVRRVIELQRIVLPHIARRRPLRAHEFVWGEEKRTEWGPAERQRKGLTPPQHSAAIAAPPNGGAGS